YEGAPTDEILWLSDTDGDGFADRREVFFDDALVATMDIAVHPDSGAIYVATRNEILRLWDENGDGIADPDRVERKLIFLDTEGNYPHNGCSGIAFDDEGNLMFGVGENLGAPYTIIGARSRKISDEGEGGNVWWARADGSYLTRYSTGFWNPFGVVHAPGGFVFVTDNDPSSRPPSRVHFYIYGGDHGYQYRYGRSGQHPFISWDGELPGTLPMLHGTGEAPCDVIFHEGHLYVAAWGDRRIERYPLRWTGSHFETEKVVIAESEGDFRPVAFAISPDGDLYVSDWVKSDYQLHGEGAVWRITGWEPEPLEMPGPEVRVGLMQAPVEGTLVDSSYWTDPWRAPAAIGTLAKDAGVLGLHRPDPTNPEFDAHQRALMLLAWRKSNPDDPTNVAIDCLRDPDETVRLLALKWISDEVLASHRGPVESIVEEPDTAILFHAAVTALARLDGDPVDDASIQKRIAERLTRVDASAKVKRAAFRVLADREKFLGVEELKKLYLGGDENLRIEVMLALQTHEDRKGARTFAQETRDDPKTSPRLRRFAREVAGRAASPIAGTESRPGKEDIEGWLSYLASAHDEPVSDRNLYDHGRIVFHRHCASCHRADGFGKQGGPDLT
ncbi:MAG: PVC-type heme-binding CxxCH protein, partial [Verrucomicrobiota bacterium]